MTIFGPLKNAFNRVSGKFTRTTLYRKLTPYNIAQIGAYVIVGDVATIRKVFLSLKALESSQYIQISLRIMTLRHLKACNFGVGDQKETCSNNDNISEYVYPNSQLRTCPQ